MSEEVKFSIPRIGCHLEYQDPDKPLGKDMVMIHRVLPEVPRKGDQVAITTDEDWYIGEVVLVRWHFSEESHSGNDYVVVKIRALPKMKDESEADNE